MSTEDQLSALFERMPIALYRSSRSGELLAGNTALANLLGYDTVADLRDGFSRLQSVYVRPELRDQLMEAIEQTGIVYDFEVELKRKDGSTVWVQDTATAVQDDDGAVIYFEGALIDATEKVKAQKGRDEFLATISHELRNPLAVVLGLSEELATNYESFTDDDRRDMANLISRQADDASWIIEDLLIAYQGDASQVSVSKSDFDITKEAERVLEVVDYPIDIRVEGEESLVHADPRRTRQILRNLVSNALRYGGDLITMQVTSNGHRVVVRVCDSGPEILEPEVERIFQPFVRGGGEQHPASVGLGLSVARTLAQLMGGDLTYRYEKSMSCFILSLPSA